MSATNMRSFCLEDTLDFAVKTANLLKNGDCLTLQGDLGAGKTTFVQKLIETLSENPVGVTSPTFNLLQTYQVRLSDGTETTIWHYDLYRLEHEEEAWELAIDDALEGGITIIEWPELIMEKLPDDRISLIIEFGEQPEGREFLFQSNGPAQQRLEEAELC
ncbi:MAG: tRNA (adenosine(37)-N6)-threonylcarbamoyltransferase complex ATPase subunit type 1 TsaE [Rickettsiales bacterium]|nr:tRNA (adenosine(37)-N6)-threonylcarbamoyltransferase complex ATPase subunit type 1 TsaE [Rickettsiales bacterium]